MRLTGKTVMSHQAINLTNVMIEMALQKAERCYCIKWSQYRMVYKRGHRRTLSQVAEFGSQCDAQVHPFVFDI